MIYLDFNASTPVLEPVLDAMVPWLRSEFANASSIHPAGLRAFAAVETARAQLANLLGCQGSEVIFTSGATESNNLALQGSATLAVEPRGRVLVSATEHKAVLEVGRSLERIGVSLRNRSGRSVWCRRTLGLGRASRTGRAHGLGHGSQQRNRDLEPPARGRRTSSSLGNTRPYRCHTVGRRVTDGCSRLGCRPSVALGHKMYAPKGVGALYIRKGISLRPIVYGGGHERGLRSGSYNVPGIVALGASADLLCRGLTAKAAHESVLRDQLHNLLAERLPNVRLNGHPTRRLPNTVNLSFEGADGNAIIARLCDVAVSSGSACTSAVPTPSHVLVAMGLTPDVADASLRFSLGWTTTASEVDVASGRTRPPCWRFGKPSTLVPIASEVEPHEYRSCV